MDKFEEIIQKQKDFQTLLNQPIHEIGYSNQCFLALIREVTEALECTTWKSKQYRYGWKNNQIFLKSQLKAELADVLIFYINILSAHNITYQELCEEILSKIKLNTYRQETNY